MGTKYGGVAVATALLATACAPLSVRSALPNPEPTSAQESTSVPKPAVLHKVVRPATESATAAFGGTHLYPDGLRVTVTQILRNRLGKAVKAQKLKKGAPIQILTVKVTNRSGATVKTSGSAIMTYGQRHQVAPAVAGKAVHPMSGTVAPGKSQQGTFAFAVPRKSINNAALSFSFDLNHQPALFQGSLDYSPGDSTVFNLLRTSRAKQLSIVEHIGRSIDAAPKDSTIRIAQYAFDVESTAKKLVKAHRRGVHVQLLVDRHKRYAAQPWEDYNTSRQTLRLTRELGTDKKKSSFVTMCQASCMSNRTSAMHAKIYLFSQVGSSHEVSMVSSANITRTNSKNSWNNINTLVANQTIYDSLKKYFDDMTRDTSNHNYYRTTTSGKYKLYLYPRSSKRATLATALDHVSCTGAAPGYGNGGHTVIRIAMYSWATSRIDLARKVWKLHDSGCRVEIIYNSGRTSVHVQKVLFRRSAKYGVIRLYDAWLDRNLDDRPEQYMHHKVLAINGVWSGRRNAKVTYAGSQNFTGNATTDNNDIILRILDDATYDAYAKNLSYIQDHSPLRLFRPAPPVLISSSPAFG